MFKKPKKGSTKQNTAVGLRKRTVDDDEDYEKEEEDHQPSLVLGQKRKRAAMSGISKRGMDATLLLVSNQQQQPTESAGMNSSKTSNPETFSSTQDGILQQKHQLAMERYIQEKMGLATAEDQSEKTKQKPVASEQDLYLQLAKTAQDLAGKSHSSKTDELPVARAEKEEGGSVLVAGTGIAEVILPVEDRLKTIEETARATRDKLTGKKLSDERLLPTRATQNASVIPNRFAVGSTTKQQHPAEIESNVSIKGKLQQKAEEHIVDADRLGFAATRRRGQATDPNSHWNNRNPAAASDDRTFQQFVAKQHRKGK